MIRLRIDAQEVEIDEKINPATSIGVAEIQDPESSAAGYSKTVEVPFTPRNMRIFGFANDLYSKEQFNNAMHTAEYLNDDAVVMRGIAQIEKFTYTAGAQGQVSSGAFHVSVVGAAFEWITSAKGQIDALNSDEAVTYEMQPVYDNSVSDAVSLVKFFPVDRGAFWNEVDDVKVARAALDLRDYHPFVNVWRLMGLIFGKFTVKTSLQTIFEKLYYSGYMPVNEDLSYIEEENAFYIGSSADDAIDVGSIGFENQKISMNLYDLWQTKEYHNNNGVISRVETSDGWRAAFTPTETAVVRLETKLQFTTKISNGSTGYWNNILNQYGECLYVNCFSQSIGAHTEAVTLTLDKCREAKAKTGDNSRIFIPAMETDKTYVVYLESRRERIDRLFFSYRLSYTDLGQLKRGGNWYVVHAPKGPGGGHFQIASTSGGVASERDISVFYFFEIQNDEVSFELDSATKDFYTLQKGATYPISASFLCSHEYGINPKDANVRLFIGAENSIKPVFSNSIGKGDKVSISTIGGTSTQLEFLAALRQMFNLMFYTNPLTREVFIEPRTSFYNLSRKDIIDWREKIDYSKSVTIEELGADVGNALKLAYSEGGDVVQRYNWKNRTELGAYSTPLLNKVADEVKELANPIFTPFLRRKVDVVGMTLPQNVSDKTQDLIGEVDLDITPIIGYFSGAQSRTAGADAAQYPLYPALQFQDIASRINLGFDDLQALPVVEGLNQYYQDNISAYNHGRRITIYLRLDPHDVEALLMPNTQMRDLRGVFMIRHDGEDVPCLLEKVCDYNAASGASTKCQFITDPNIRITGNDTVVVTYNGKYTAYDNTVVEYYEGR